MRLLDILLRTPAYVLQIRDHAQRLVLGGSQLLFQFLHAGGQVLGGAGGLLGGLLIQGLLFVSHATLLQK